jgi:hypothetical protein
VAAGTLVGVTSPAHAAVWSLYDGFEGDPASRWSCWHTVEDWFNSCAFAINRADWPESIRPRTGQNRGSLSGGTGWSDIGRSVRLTPFKEGVRLSCVAKIYVKHHAGIGNTVHAQLEVIDEATWTYVSVKPFTTVSADVNPWRQIVTDGWVAARPDVFVRIGIVGDNGSGVDTLQLDDMEVRCLYL